MSGSKKAADLIKSIRVRAMIPDNQVTFTESDFLRFATEEMQNTMFGEVLRHHEDFFLYDLAIPLEVGKNRYRIPSRAGGVRLRDVSYRDTSGNIREMTRIEIQDVPGYTSNTASGIVSAFYVQNNQIVLYPDNRSSSITGDLIMSFYARPNEMVSESRTATITNINTSTGEVTVDGVPTDTLNNTLFSTTTKLDIISQDSPHVLEVFDVRPTAVNTTTNTITFNVADLSPTNSDSTPGNIMIQVGDYINLAGESVVPQIPAELHMQLAMRVAMRCMTALGDLQGYQNVKDELTETKKNTTAIIDNRVEGAPRKVVNRHSILRDGLFRRRFRFRS